MAYPVLKIANLMLRATYTIEGAEDLMSNMKLQKMLYYQQGFHLAYFGTPLFDEEIEAWMHGPVVPSVYTFYEEHCRNGIMPDLNDDFMFNEQAEINLFNQVLQVYGKYSACGLMNMTHNEAPWQTTPTGRGNIISKSKLKEFFKTLLR